MILPAPTTDDVNLVQSHEVITSTIDGSFLLRTDTFSKRNPQTKLKGDMRALKVCFYFVFFIFECCKAQVLHSPFVPFGGTARRFDYISHVAESGETYNVAKAWKTRGAWQKRSSYCVPTLFALLNRIPYGIDM